MAIDTASTFLNYGETTQPERASIVRACRLSALAIRSSIRKQPASVDAVDSVMVGDLNEALSELARESHLKCAVGKVAIKEAPEEVPLASDKELTDDPNSAALLLTDSLISYTTLPQTPEEVKAVVGVFTAEAALLDQLTADDSKTNDAVIENAREAIEAVYEQVLHVSE